MLAVNLGALCKIAKTMDKVRRDKIRYINASDINSALYEAIKFASNSVIIKKLVVYKDRKFKVNPKS